MASTSRKSSTPESAEAKRAFGPQARQIIYNVHQYLVENKRIFNLCYNSVESTAQATGISPSSVARIVREAKMSLAAGNPTPTFVKPKNRRGGHNKIEFDEGILRRKIYEFYTKKKESPTVRKVLHCLKEEGVVNCSTNTLRIKIAEIGFKWKSCKYNRKFLIEQPEIVASRFRYLQAIGEHKQSQRPVIYLDEAYTHSLHNAKVCSQLRDDVGAATSVSTGKRLIVACIGGDIGFIENTLLAFVSCATAGDCDRNMNLNNFQNWIQERVIPNLPPSSVVIMDNVAYHCLDKNKKRDSVGLKKDMQDWLRQKRVPFSPDMTKEQLMNIIKTIPDPTQYILDEILEKNGHTVLRIPPYHSDLNPIKLIWKDIKGIMGREIKRLSNSTDEKKVFQRNSFDECTQEKWKDCCAQVEKIEEEYRISDRLMEGSMDTLIMNLDDIVTSDESSEDED